MPAGSHFLIEEGMLSDKIGAAVFNGESFYSIGIKNQLLHAVHPLGWFCSIDLTVDGRRLSKEDVFFEIRGQWVCTAQMHTITDIFWYIMEEARLNFRFGETLAPGAHAISCELTASTLEVATQLDTAEKWPRRRQTVSVTACL
jgi:hypothetical protein